MPSSPGATAPLLLHPGYHKTGTTWYQHTLFKPRYGYQWVMTHEEMFGHIVKPHGLAFDPEPLRSMVAERRAQCAPGLVALASSEPLSGNPFYGARESDVYAQRLKQIAPDARILLTIREQMRALTSVYMQYLSRAGTVPAEEFFADDPVIGYFAFDPVHYEYHRLVSLYCDLFGPESVLVVTQEALARDQRKVAADIAAFAGVSADISLDDLPVDRIGASYPESVAPGLRWVNHFRAGPAGHGINMGPLSDFAYRAVGTLGRTALKPLLGKSRPVTSKVLRRFEGRYAESNRKLKALMGDRIDLTGYPM